jgi:hypothetical protein
LIPIAFHDAEGVRWRVVPHAALGPEHPRNTTLVFTSERGDRRTCDGCLPEGGTWEEVDERVWCALLRHADAVPADADES